jgi:hypothetical protein
MWQVKEDRADVTWLDPTPIRVLYFFDGPRAFICKDHLDNNFLAYQLDEDANALRYLVVPCGDDLEHQLTAGLTSVLDALSQKQTWLIDLGNDWRVLRAWKIAIRDLPDDALPRPGVMLWAHQTPVIQSPASRAASGETEVFPVFEPDPLRSFVRGGVICA